LSLFWDIGAEGRDEDSAGKSPSQGYPGPVHFQKDRAMPGPKGDQADHSAGADAQGTQAEAQAAAGPNDRAHLGLLARS